ncbi:nSTAND1 domain-containing NTPase [Actinophytocola xanthii]|uniref:Novel STAND NTPase 1 domain-containing protein n=1 Tax=Actinophytocola xanthii TaxID=1912961 RepID=A0A1Q8C6J1_9PSEU|nr:hypothetical protein [Actinophytocola xanthii]OLF09979.1 hypothetical protein BU204_32225 [Actinophytocola xanthii]
MPRPERRVDPADGPLARFALGLRELRHHAGSPGYRELARRAHYSATTLAQAARGAGLPSLAVTLAYVAACGGDVAEWERRWRATAAELSPPRVPEPDGQAAREGPAPYVGLAAYGPQDAYWFRGRDRLVAALLDRVERQRFVAVVGASGSGKSSVLRAGLVPAVSADRDRWSALVLTPGARPLEECAVRLGVRTGVAAGQLVGGFREEPGAFGLAVRQLMATRPDGAELVLVVDQFEEVFTLCADARERSGFITALLDAAYDPECRLRVVVGVRSDFYTHCARHTRLAEALQDAQVLVGPMSTDELTDAITAPAARAGLMVEKTLVQTVLHDAADRPGALPFVSHALWETWRRRHGSGLFLAGYQSAGGVSGAVAQTADRLYQDLDERHRRTVREVLLRLTALGEGTEDTRRRVSRAELLDSPDRDAVVEVLDRLTAARLVTRDATTVEIAHEALIAGWPLLRDWLAEDREAIRAHRRLTEASAEWESHGRDESLLYRGARLGTWLDRSPARLNDAERAFLAAGRAVSEREERLRRRRVRLAVGGLGSAVTLVTVLAVVALMMAGRADRERALAIGRQLAADARAQLAVDPELGLLLAREAYAATPNEETEGVLRQATTQSHIRAVLPENRDSLGRPAAVTGVAFSADGEHLATTTAGGLLQVFGWTGATVGRTPERVVRNGYWIQSPVFGPDNRHIAFTGVTDGATVVDWTRGGEPPRPSAGKEVTLSAAYSADGRWVASGGQYGTVWIRPALGESSPRVLRGHDGAVAAVAFSPDGTRLVSASAEDGTIRVWNLVAPGRPLVLLGPETQVAAVAFSPDGRRLATVDVQGTVRTWNFADMTTSAVLGSHDGPAYHVAYSADGQSILSTGADGTVRIWNAGRHAAPVMLRGHDGPVLAAAFSRDGGIVVSAGADGTTRIWQVNEADDVTVLRGPESPVWSTAMSSDHRRLAVGDRTGAVRLWDLTGRAAPTVLPGSGQPVTQVVYSPDGRRIAVADDDGRVLVWNLSGHTGRPRSPHRLSGPPTARVAFSPDGTRLAAIGFNDSVSIWEIPANGHPPHSTSSPMAGEQGSLMDVVWSPDGRHVAASSDTNTVLLWDFRNPDRVEKLRGHQSAVWGLAFNRDGTRLASGGNDGTVRIWAVGDTAAPVVLRGHQPGEGTMTFSSDGSHLATTGSDTSVRISRVDGRGDPLVVAGFQAAVREIAPAGNDRFLTVHADGSVRTWRCPACGPISEVLATARGHLTRDLTPEERRTHLPGGGAVPPQVIRRGG